MKKILNRICCVCSLFLLGNIGFGGSEVNPEEWALGQIKNYVRIYAHENGGRFPTTWNDLLQYQDLSDTLRSYDIDFKNHYSFVALGSLLFSHKSLGDSEVVLISLLERVMERVSP